MGPISPKIKELMAQTDALSAQNTGMTVNICLNYGGRDEIVRSVRKLAARCAAGVLDPDAITEADISAGLDSADIPDPDLVIRPGGELRISNFLLWQSAYSEFYFTDTFWPDMDERELEKAILSYQSRNRRFGGV
jgi:undecaprenyl diphosphate synthase